MIDSSCAGDRPVSALAGSITIGRSHPTTSGTCTAADCTTRTARRDLQAWPPDWRARLDHGLGDGPRAAPSQPRRRPSRRAPGAADSRTTPRSHSGTIIDRPCLHPLPQRLSFGHAAQALGRLDYRGSPGCGRWARGAKLDAEVPRHRPNEPAPRTSWPRSRPRPDRSTRPPSPPGPRTPRHSAVVRTGPSTTAARRRRTQSARPARLNAAERYPPEGTHDEVQRVAVAHDSPRPSAATVRQQQSLGWPAARRGSPASRPAHASPAWTASRRIGGPADR